MSRENRNDVGLVEMFCTTTGVCLSSLSRIVVSNFSAVMLSTELSAVVASERNDNRSSLLMFRDEILCDASQVL